VNPPAVALVLALVPVLADGAVVEDELEVGGAAGVELVVGLLAAKAAPAMRAKLETAITRGALRMEFSLGALPSRDFQTDFGCDRSAPSCRSVKLSRRCEGAPWDGSRSGLSPRSGRGSAR